MFVATCCTLIKVSFVFWKVSTLLPKFNGSFFKKNAHNSRLSPKYFVGIHFLTDTAFRREESEEKQE